MPSGRRLYAFYLTSAAHHDYRLPAREYTQRFAEDERYDRYQRFGRRHARRPRRIGLPRRRLRLPRRRVASAAPD